MGEKEIREKYGGKLDKAINRAIRAETATGNAALDKLAKLSGPAASSGWTDDSGQATPAAAAYHKHKRGQVDPLVAQILEKWGIAPVKKKPAKTKTKTRPRRTR